MRLILLIGMNKTGSSTLQTVLASNKISLRNEGFFIPESPYDTRMLEGAISPGNGAIFARILAERNKGKLYRYVKGIISEAKRYRCQSIILSNEVLIRVFSRQEILDITAEVLEVFQLEPHLLCIHRNVYEHALSLFKHRAKNGLYKSYAHWANSDYETLDVMKRFLDRDLPTGWHWRHVNYSNGIKSILIDYLNSFGFKGELSFPSRSINPSLSLAELRLIKVFESLYPNIAPYMINSLRETVNERSDCKNELKEFMVVMSSLFCSENMTLEKWSELLCEKERMSLLATPKCLEENLAEGCTFPNNWDSALQSAIQAYRGDFANRFLKRLLKTFVFKPKSLIFRLPYDPYEFGGKL